MYLWVCALVFHQPFNVSLPDEQEDDFPGRVNIMSLFSHQVVCECRRLWVICSDLVVIFSKVKVLLNVHCVFVCTGG